MAIKLKNTIEIGKMRQAGATAREMLISAAPPTQEIPQEPDSGNSWWIVGLVVGIGAVLIIGIVFYTRRRREIDL